MGQPEPKKMRMSTEAIRNDNETRKEESFAEKPKDSGEVSGRERLKRHHKEMAGRVWIPDIWGQESYLKEWVDCSAFDSCLVPNGVVSARRALVEECRRANSSRGMTIENRC